MTPERQNEIWVTLPHWFRKYLRDEYDDAKLALSLDPNNPRIQSHISFLECYFGKHNLTAQSGEKPKEPKFKVGDKVVVNGKFISEIYDIDLKGYPEYPYHIQKQDGYYGYFAESDLAPYTEPKEDGKISDKKGLLDKIIDAGYNFLDRHNPDVISERGTSNIDYARYRLELAKEIAVAMIYANWEPAEIPHDAVENANEIVKQLKETEE